MVLKTINGKWGIWKKYFHEKR